MRYKSQTDVTKEKMVKVNKKVGCHRSGRMEVRDAADKLVVV